MRTLLNGLLLALALGLSLTASAHEIRPAYLELREIASDTYEVFWKVPTKTLNQRLDLALEFSSDTKQLNERVGGYIENAHVQRMRIQRDGGLVGSTLQIVGLENTPTDVLLRLQWIDGTELVHRFTPDATTLIIPRKQGLTQIAATYLELGVEHILLGIDHLLFVLALLLIVPSTRKLIGTITAFTLAHSINLALATLGLIHLPIPPVEAIIALSIVFVAAEIIRTQQGETNAPYIHSTIYYSPGTRCAQQTSSS